MGSTLSDPPAKAIDLLHMTILFVEYRNWSGGATAVASVEAEANSIINIVNAGLMNRGSSTGPQSHSVDHCILWKWKAAISFWTTLQSILFRLSASAGKDSGSRNLRSISQERDRPPSWKGNATTAKEQIKAPKKLIGTTFNRWARARDLQKCVIQIQGGNGTFREAFVLLTVRRQNIVATRCTPRMFKWRSLLHSW